MHLPHIDPNFVMWCNFASDVITSLAASTACIAVLNRIRQVIKKDVTKG